MENFKKQLMMGMKGIDHENSAVLKYYEDKLINDIGGFWE